MEQDRQLGDGIAAASVTTGATGTTASAGQFTVEAPSAGRTKSGISIV
jgi:hypothetical protein